MDAQFLYKGAVYKSLEDLRPAIQGDAAAEAAFAEDEGAGEGSSRENAGGGGGTGAAKGCGYVVGEAAEYYSTSHKQWVPCEIVAVDGCKVQVSVKPGAWLEPAEVATKLRQREGPRIPLSTIRLEEALQAEQRQRPSCQEGAIASPWEERQDAEQDGEPEPAADTGVGQGQERGKGRGRGYPDDRTPAPQAVQQQQQQQEPQQHQHQHQHQHQQEQPPRPAAAAGAGREHGRRTPGVRSRHHFEEVAGFLALAGDEHRCQSKEEAEALVLSDPRKFMGYTFTTSGDLVFARERGNTLLTAVTEYRSRILHIRKQQADEAAGAGEVEALFSDGWCDNTDYFPGGLENGKAGTQPWAVWRRPGRGEGLHDHMPVTLVAAVDPNDIIQGSLGDCWLLSSICALAEFPSDVMRLVSPLEGSPQGKYCVRLWSWRQRQWQKITVDDRLPCRQTSSRPSFAKITRSGELYVALLEKAAAVLCGGYAALHGNYACFGFGLLTGCDRVFNYVQQEKGKWTGGRQEYFMDRVPTHVIPVKDGAAVPNFNHDLVKGRIVQLRHLSHAWPTGQSGDVPCRNRDMWQMLERWDQKNYMMVCDTAAPGRSDDQKSPDGLVLGHAYALLQVKSNVAGSGFNLCQVRNPHATQEPNLPWKDGDELWKRHPEVEAKLRPAHRDDGTFWLSDTDFFANFTNISVLKKEMGDVRRSLRRL